MTNITLCVSKYVVYASNGICLVEDIQKLSFVKGAEEKVYYILRPKNDRGSTIYIPEDNSILLEKIRDILTADEIKSLLDELEDSCCEWIEDRKQRALHFKTILSLPHPKVLLPAMRTICRKQEELSDIGKKLNASDRDTFNSALRHVIDEFTFALGDETKAKELIQNIIGRTPESL